MQLGEGVEWGDALLTVLALLPAGQALPASRLAEFHGVPPSYLAKHLQALAHAGIVESTAGRTGGYRLARDAGDITLLEVVQAVESDQPAFRCSEIRRRVAGAAVQAYYWIKRVRDALAERRAQAVAPAARSG